MPRSSIEFMTKTEHPVPCVRAHARTYVRARRLAVEELHHPWLWVVRSCLPDTSGSHHIPPPPLFFPPGSAAAVDMPLPAAAG